MTTIKTENVSIDRLSPDSCFRLSFPLKPAFYAEIEKKLPALPLLIIDKKKRVVAGHDYLFLLKKRRQKQAFALIIEGNDGEKLRFAFHFKHTLEDLNPYEKLLFLHKARKYFTLMEIRKEAEFDFPWNDWDDKRIDRSLHPRTKLLLMENRIGLRNLLSLQRMTAADQQTMTQIFQSIRFNENQQAKILEIMEELISRDKTSAAHILKNAGIDSLLNLEMPQKKIIDALLQVRYPVTTLAWEEWRQRTREFSRDQRFQLTPHPFFEKKEVQLSIRCRNLEEAKKIIKSLK